MTDHAPAHLLTVLHAAELTGPPLLALRFLRWLREERPWWTLDTLFLDAGGPLVEDFERLGTVVVADPIRRTSSSWRSVHVGNRALARRLTALGRLDVVHVHCAGSMRVVPSLPKAPVLCHVHELSVGLDFHLDRGARRHLEHADRFVTVSDAVTAQLHARFNVEPGRVERQWGFVDDAALAAVPDREALAREEGIAPDSFLVVASGVRHWRKAPELFVRVAQRARDRHPERRWAFVWVGGEGDAALTHLVEEAGLSDVVRFVDHVDDPLRWIGAADVFLLPAREDAFPLVSVEAAALGRPIVSFDSGGTPELIAAAGCGTTVAFPDVDAVVDALAALADDAAGRERLGAAGARFAREHLTLAQAGPRLVGALETTMGRA